MSNKSLITRCPICGTEFEGGWTDACPYCNWLYMGCIDDIDIDDPDTDNPVTIRQAKKNLANGLDIWGEPLPKK